jgi:hypothetical protein
MSALSDQTRRFRVIRHQGLAPYGAEKESHPALAPSRRSRIAQCGNVAMMTGQVENRETRIERKCQQDIGGEPRRLASSAVNELVPDGRPDYRIEISNQRRRGSYFEQAPAVPSIRSRHRIHMDDAQQRQCGRCQIQINFAK